MIAVLLRSATMLALLFVPRHVQTYLYYSAAGVNENVPAAYMAAHADFIETDATHPALVRAFKAAGGRYAVAYTDPTYVPYCVPPFTPPAGPCAGPIGNLVREESAWLHDASGERVRRADSYTHEYQEILNPGSPYARAAYTRYTRALAAQAPIDLFFADDSGSALDGPGDSPRNGLFYRFNGVAAEISGDAQWLRDEQGLLAAAARPVIVNGGGPGGQPAYAGAFLHNRNVVGQNEEDCFSREGGLPVASADDGRWQAMENALLAITHDRVYAICMMKGTPQPATRLYALASWWLSYDPAWSVAAPVEPAPDGHAVFAEYAIVPRAPLQTAGPDIGALARAGVYVREFARCYQDGRPLGPCAALVNPSASQTLPVPRFAYPYGRHLELDDRSAYAGGRAWWARGVPRRLGPLTAAIVAKATLRAR